MRIPTVFLLFLRQSAWKVLLTLAAMAALETALFAALMPDPAAHSLETALLLCRRPLALTLALGFGVMVGLLVRNGNEKGRQGYTLDRLRIPPGEVLLWQSVYNTLAVLLLWGTQVLTFFLLCWVYQSQGGFVGPQTFYLTCWQDDLFHSFLPMEEWSRWLRNLAWALGLGVTAACFSAQQRQQNKGIALFLLIGMTPPAFALPMGNATADAILGLICLAILMGAWSNARTLGKEGEHEETQTP